MSVIVDFFLKPEILKKLANAVPDKKKRLVKVRSNKC